MDDQRNDHIDPKGPKQRNRPKQLQTHNLPADDVKNINSTSKGINKMQQNSKFRLCGERDETINHIVSECS